MERVIGIDFGTSTSLIGEGIEGQRVTLQPIGRSTESEMPSTVGTSDNRILVGEDAEDLPLAQSRRSIKRAITECWQEIWLGGNRRTTVDADLAITEVLRAIGDRAMRLGLVLDEGSIRLSCPASWTGAQRDRLMRLAKDAGLPVTEHTLIDEPVAAGIAWVVHQTEDLGKPVDGKVLVFDMGGGTLDVAHLAVHAKPGREPQVTVLSSVGLAEAGDRLDEEIAAALLDKYSLFENLASAPDDPALVSAARHTAAEVKQTLSTEPVVMTQLEAPGWNARQLAFKRDELETIFTPQWQRAELKVLECLRASTLTYRHNDGSMAARKLPTSKLVADVNHVVLVGGMSYIPMVAERLQALFPDAAVHREYGVSPVNAVVAGLSETSVYDRISFHRPAYDFVLTFPDDPDRKPEILYRAYDPLYTFGQAITTTNPCFEATLRSGLPRSGTGMIVIRSPQGAPVSIVTESEVLDGIPVEFGYQGIRIRLKPSGEVLVVDGRNTAWEARVSGWPAVRGSQDLEILMKRKLREPDETPEPPHPLNNRYG